jgi:hypothetical protein
LSPPLTPDYFGTNSLATILGFFGFFTGLTVGIGGLLFPLALVHVNVLSILIPAGFTLLGAFCFLKARPPQATDTVASQAAPDQESVC